MKPTLALLTMALVASASYAAEPRAADQHAAKFSEHKQLVLSLIAKRQAILAEEQSCVQAASNDAGLKACHETARGAREAMASKAREAKERHPR